MSDEEKPPSPAEIQEAMAELEAKGLIRRTGEIRDGRPVYVATKYWPLNPCN